jgi:hypothetical protein
VTDQKASPANHAGCRDYLRQEMAKLGCEVTVSTAPPLIETPHRTEGCKCPHGTTYWIHPTSEQIAQWARDGVA